MEVSESLKRCPLFAHIDPEALGTVLNCLAALKRVYRKDEFVFKAGEKITSVGVVLSGGVRVLQEDFWGRRMILTHISPSGLFGEAFSCADTAAIPVSVMASETSEILLLDYRKMANTCKAACQFHAMLTTNMMRVLAEKNILLTRKMEHLSKRSTREKLLSFLSAAQLGRPGQHKLEIPFNRQELADYLCVDRSALSRELAAMQAEGLLRYDKNWFELLRNNEAE